ncbi:PHB depolymerase family esterase [Streptomyces endophyticus]|uniref:Alpha/beta hydrolase n=1 Tax=Streptomyces endophyticus TaxID=714166 RepID=A0ABU6FEM7_9ACTN|nr:PHB depolymerase family esterase [Streptomyces endophyticus]MEB8342393.1 alpha/beta hydrolase [Streptomyces endophyticus]
MSSPSTASPTGSRTKSTTDFYVTGATTQFASRHDQRLSYCLYVPTAHRTAEQPLPLLVMQHGTGRTGPQYRDAMAGFAEEHGIVVLAPLFPAGLGSDPDDLHNFKFMEYEGIRFDLALLAIVEEAAQRVRVDAGRFVLHGFSGGGQFAHRFLLLHPERLAGVSIGAPGRVTLIDPERAWWLGTGGFEERFGKPVDLDRIREVPVQLVVGEEDTETWEINNPGDSNWMEGADAVGRTRVERITALYENYRSLGIDASLDIVPGVAHNGMGVLDEVRAFAAGALGRR